MRRGYSSSARRVSDLRPPPDTRVSWCRILRTGPPCPHLCADCKRADALLTDEERARILRGPQ